MSKAKEPNQRQSDAIIKNGIKPKDFLVICETASNIKLCRKSDGRIVNIRY